MAHTLKVKVEKFNKISFVLNKFARQKRTLKNAIDSVATKLV